VNAAEARALTEEYEDECDPSRAIEYVLVQIEQSARRGWSSWNENYARLTNRYGQLVYDKLKQELLDRGFKVEHFSGALWVSW
jgi:hypothetical protein